MASDSHTITGKVYYIGKTQTFGTSGFTKRDLVLDTGDKYPQKILFECMKKMIEECDTLSVGDTVTIDFNLNGKEYIKDMSTAPKFFNSLVAWKITIDKKAVQPIAAKSFIDESEQLPF